MREIRIAPDISRCAEIYEQLTHRLIERNITVSTMESCTSGTVASLITDTEGSSAVFRGAIVSYTNDVKCSFGVPEETINKFGVYSPNTATAMAKCAAEKFGSDIAIGITGSLMNKDKYNPDSIPGSVYFSVYCMGRAFEFHISVKGKTRNECKREVASAVAAELLSMLGNR